jgi:ubiquinone/menaquinone biosynthesis C-methylase UbiE
MEAIRPGGGDTGKPLNTQKRLVLMESEAELRGRRMLDCGCGTGQYVLALLAAGADVWGIEYEEAKVAEFKSRNPEVAQRVSVGDIQSIAFDDNSFDIVLANEVLEHVPDDRQGLREMYRVLKDGGQLFVFSPNRLYPFEIHGVYTRSSDRFVPIHTPFIPYIPVALGSRYLRYWARNYWPWQLRALIREAGFAINDVGYVWQTFENISGRQPRLLSWLKPALRQVTHVGEKVPGLRAVGAVSQFISAIKPGGSGKI